MSQRMTDSPPPPVWTDPRIDRTREVAIATARELLVKEGWDAVTHLRVSEQSGLGRATIYRHWPEPWDLLCDTLAAEAMAVQVTPTGAVRRDLVAQVKSICDWLSRADGVRILAALIDRAQWEPRLATVMGGLVHENVTRLQQLLADSVDAGELRGDVDLDLAVAQLFGPVVYRCLISGEEVSEDFARAVVDDFLR